jgi:hypothetical protein
MVKVAAWGDWVVVVALGSEDDVVVSCFLDLWRWKGFLGIREDFVQIIN